MIYGILGLRSKIQLPTHNPHRFQLECRINIKTNLQNLSTDALVAAINLFTKQHPMPTEDQHDDRNGKSYIIDSGTHHSQFRTAPKAIPSLPIAMQTHLANGTTVPSTHFWLVIINKTAQRVITKALITPNMKTNLVSVHDIAQNLVLFSASTAFVIDTVPKRTCIVATAHWYSENNAYELDIAQNPSLNVWHTRVANLSQPVSGTYGILSLINKHRKTALRKRYTFQSLQSHPPHQDGAPKLKLLNRPKAPLVSCPKRPSNKSEVVRFQLPPTFIRANAITHSTSAANQSSPSAVPDTDT